MNRILGWFGAAVLGLSAWGPMAHGRVSIVPWPIVRPPIAPVPPAGFEYQWVEPVYRTVLERVWVGETSRPVENWVEVSPGVWQRCWRTEIVPAHYEDRTRRELISGGYWQLVRVERVWPAPVETGGTGTVGVDGYAGGRGEDLSKFSGLSEWPAK